MATPEDVESLAVALQLLVETSDVGIWVRVNNVEDNELEVVEVRVEDDGAIIIVTG